MSRRDPERGSVMPIVLGGIMVLAVLAYGGATLWRMVLAKAEVQRAADAACLTAANAMKYEGLPFNLTKQARAEELARGNSGLPLTFEWQVQETATEIQFHCTARATVPAPRLVWTDGVASIFATARSRARQQTMDEAEKKYPHFALVLDYSQSMESNFDGSYTANDQTDDSINDLLRAVNAFLAKRFELRYGLVIYASSVIDGTDNVALGNRDVIEQKVNAPQPCPHGTNGCATNTGGALDRARQLLDDPALPDDELQYVLLVSDGNPTAGSSNPAQAAKDAVTRLWDDGVTMFTIQIVNSQQSGSTLQTFMRSISGPPDARGSWQDYAYIANDPAKLEDLFNDIGGRLACELPVVNPIPANPDLMHVFVRDSGGNETPLENAKLHQPAADSVADLWSSSGGFRDGNYFYYKPENSHLYVTPGICERIREQHHTVHVRFRSPQLAE